MAWAIGLTMGLLMGGGAYFGALTVLSPSTPHPPGFVFPEIPLHASASHGESSITLATGQIDGEVEGLYILDHVTGDLQCWVVNTRPRGPTPGLSGTFTTNVIKDLDVALEKTPKFVMVTGNYQYGSGGGGGGRPASSIVYVADVNTGNVAGYSITWNSTLVTRGTLQTGKLNLVLVGKGRNAAIRPGGGIDVGPQP
jgi:hypothetical protein